MSVGLADLAIWIKGIPGEVREFELSWLPITGYLIKFVIRDSQPEYINTPIKVLVKQGPGLYALIEEALYELSGDKN